MQQLRRALVPAAGVVVAMVLASCGDNEDVASPAPSTSSSTTTTTAPDPFAVPDEIDAAYVESILNELYRVHGQALRATVQAGELVPEARQRIEAVFGEEAERVHLRELDIFRERDFQDLQRPPGDVTARVSAVEHGDESCILARGGIDNGEMMAGEWDRGPAVFRLYRKPPAPDPDGYNRTPWVVEAIFADNENLPEDFKC